jgi:hypothetical protein
MYKNLFKLLSLNYDVIRLNLGHARWPVDWPELSHSYNSC